MDFLERKNINLLQRLRQLQVEQCCLHIDQQIGLWYQNQVDPIVPTATNSHHAGQHQHQHHNHHHHHHHHQQQQEQQPTLEQLPTGSQLSNSKPLETPDPHFLTAISTPPVASSTTTTTATTLETQLPQIVAVDTTPTLLTAETETETTTITATATPTTTTTIPAPAITVKVEPASTETTTPPAETIITETIIKTEPIDVIDDSTVYLETASPQLPSPCMTVGASATIEVDTSTPSPVTLPHLQDGEERTIGCFLSNLKHLESFDSDATESTSSNDSYDELEGFSHEDIPPRRSNYHSYYYHHHPSTSHNHQASSSSIVTAAASASAHHHNQQSLHYRRTSNQQSATGASTSAAINGNHDLSDLKKKAIWKWANERSRLASRWTWLQAQVADLEFRIRGQNDATMHARSYKTPPLPSVLPENSCSRTVPISKDFRRRRLIKSSQILSDSTKKLVKFSHVPCICSALPQTVAPCLSCNGRYNYLRQIEGENAPVSERLSLLDPCCHPVLSFPDDITLGSQLSYLLKQETINRKPTKGRPGRKKGSTAANLAAAAAAAAANGDKNAKHPGKKGKYYHGMVGRPPGSQKNPSQTMITSNKLRRKYRKHSNNTNNYDSNNWNSTNNHNHSNNRRNKRIRRASSMNESSVCSESSNQYRPNHFSNNTAQNVTRRRRSEQSAYDIDNIVIPFSIAATTRVEILEYKEIMTPSWRIWENGTCQAEAVEEDVEDTSDEAYITRHSKGESEEKKRFSLKPPKTRVDNIQCNSIPSLN